MILKDVSIRFGIVNLHAYLWKGHDYVHKGGYVLRVNIEVFCVYNAIVFIVISILNSVK